MGAARQSRTARSACAAPAGHACASRARGRPAGHPADSGAPPRLPRHAGAEPHAGTGVLVPASYTWSDTTVQTLQTFGILLRWGPCGTSAALACARRAPVVGACALPSGPAQPVLSENNNTIPPPPSSAPCSVAKMVLFALIINAVGSVNSIPQARRSPRSRPCAERAPRQAGSGAGPADRLCAPAKLESTLPPPTFLFLQVLALVLVALLHLVYLRLCLPFRMRIELAAGAAPARPCVPAAAPSSHGLAAAAGQRGPAGERAVPGHCKPAAPHMPASS